VSHAISRSIPLLLLAAAWEAATRAGLISPYALPPLTHVVASLAQLLTEDLWFHAVRSLTRAGSGLALAVVCGVSAGVLMAWYHPFRVLVSPLIRFFYPMPKSALIPITIMWLGLGDMSKIVLIFIGCMLPIVVSAFNATRGVEDVLVWSGRGLGASQREVLWEIVLPAALPEILNGIRTSLALCFILLVSSELILSRDGLGYLVGFLGEGGDYSGMFAGVVTISALGFAADRIYVALTNRWLVWRGS
jgi:NitT/TauT family transport system permease protein